MIGGLEMSSTPPRHAAPAKISRLVHRSPRKKKAKTTDRLGVRYPIAIESLTLRPTYDLYAEKRPTHPATPRA